MTPAPTSGARGAASAGSAPSTVLVTGGAGFIGSVVCRRLADAGHRVIVADHGDDLRHRRAHLALADLDIHTSDLAHTDLTRLLEGVDRVIHLAGRPGVQSSWGAGFAHHLDGNVGLTQRLLEAALEAPVARVVVASSSSVYGETAGGLASEDAPLAPTSPYGVSKAAVELLVRTYAERGVPVVALRYFTVYGRGQRPDMALHRIIDAALGGDPFPQRGSGRQQRDFTHVDDAAAATEAAIFAPLAPGTICNVGGGRPVRLASLISAVGLQLGRSVPVIAQPPAPGDPGRTAADPRLAAALLGWSPRVSLADGIADQIRHHRTAVFAAAPAAASA